MDFSGLDTDSIGLAIELLKLDLESLIGTSKGKYLQGEVPDSELAIKAYISELESLESFVIDRRMSLSIARAVGTDGNAIHEEQLAESRAAQDRQFALNLDSRRRAKTSDDGVEATESNSQALYVGCADDDELDQAESSSWAASRPKPKTPQPTAVCTSCGDRHVFYDVA
ncbi:uncharacterized protein HRG_07604 [Hirsutella rhossiliensis]|uniref:Uncharacterized protein n=1 Tax=Hirsutella rhossiliensis TaxID=111463 RepID=A0A9P8MWJ4_9HYPO|nr:uncharacterized protein HRG_07604 [Hirsutella rhossiliensis]KAH0961526.1 hypothetical protein HRG_07604 [Hirsutella rhossiliensis]